MNIDQLLGKTLTKISGGISDDELIFTTDNGEKYRMYGPVDCCNIITIEDIAGDLLDLIGSPILQAEESESNKNPEGVKVPEYQDSFTWTFYKLATAKGYVTIRWYGSSNGYYAERAAFEQIYAQD